MTARMPHGYVGRATQLRLKFGDHPQHVVVNDVRGHPLTARDLIVTAGQFFNPVCGSIGAIAIHEFTLSLQRADCQEFGTPGL